MGGYSQYIAKWGKNILESNCFCKNFVQKNNWCQVKIYNFI